jgi:hypothetical protein
MKFYDAGLSIFIIVFVITCICAGVSYEYLGQSSPITQEIENIAEKEGEAIILKETGIDVTPKPQVTNAIQK